MGLVDGLPDNAVNYDEGELKSQEADPERNQRTLKEALQCLTMMHDAALAFVEQDREENGWSQNIGLFFHCYPHARSTRPTCTYSTWTERGRATKRSSPGT